jgi:hypothetical protein
MSYWTWKRTEILLQTGNSQFCTFEELFAPGDSSLTDRPRSLVHSPPTRIHGFYIHGWMIHFGIGSGGTSLLSPVPHDQSECDTRNLPHGVRTGDWRSVALFLPFCPIMEELSGAFCNHPSMLHYTVA